MGDDPEHSSDESSDAPDDEKNTSESTRAGDDSPADEAHNSADSRPDSVESDPDESGPDEPEPEPPAREQECDSGTVEQSAGDDDADRGDRPESSQRDQSDHDSENDLSAGDTGDGSEPSSPNDADSSDSSEPVTAGSEAADGGTITPAGSQGVVQNPETGEEIIEGPETDEEMPLAQHIEEMMKRLGVVFLFGGVATLIAFPSAEPLIEYFWTTHIPNPLDNRPRLYGPLEFVLTRLKVAGLAGLIVGLPVFVYQTYRFMRPGLYPTERRYYLAAVPTSLLLGIVGGIFAHFLVLPAIFAYFTSYTQGAAVIAFGLSETFNLILIMIAFMTIVFQIPLFIMLAIMMNLVTRRWLQDKRLIFWGTFFGIAFLFSPDPTGMAPIIVTLTMIVLYEGTLALLRWTGN